MAKIVDLLQKVGLVEVTSASGPEALSDRNASPAAANPSPDVTTRPDPLRYLAPPGSPPDFEEAVSAHAEEAVDFPFEEIYASAGIKAPEHGFTVFKLIEMFESDELRELEPGIAAKVIAGMLRRLPTGAVEIEDIVRDAVQRDRALDAFETFLADRLAASEEKIELANRALQEEIDELTRKNNALIEANRASVAQERERLERWQQRKLREEQRLFKAVQPFVEANPVTRDEDSEIP